MTAPSPPPPGMVSVPVSTFRPSPTAFAKNVWKFASGSLGEDVVRRMRRDPSRGDPSSEVKELHDSLTPMNFAPLAEKETGAAWVFDATGMRLEGYRRGRLAFGWAEASQVRLEAVNSPKLGITELRVAMWPGDPARFAAGHSELAPTWDDRIGGYSFMLSRGRVLNQTKADLALVGLQHAGPRCDGQLHAYALE